MKGFALVTGGAGGLGKAFGFELAKQGFNTILIDLPNKGLKEICIEIERKYKTKSYYYEIDLTKINKIIETTNDINNKYQVTVLINNAGVGGTERFNKADINYLNTIIQLNVMATTIMTKQMLTNLQRQKKSFVLNVSSMGAYSPMAFRTVYSASKTFIYSFTRGLSEEFRKTNIFISVVTPGPMKTNPEVTERINKQGILGKFGLISTKKVAEISINQLFKYNSLIMLTNANRFNWLLMKLIPIRIRLPLLSRVFERELKN